MDIQFLLKQSMLEWKDSDLNKDFDNILDLLGSLPEPKNLETKITRFSTLDKDIERKEAKKEDVVLNGDMYEI